MLVNCHQPRVKQAYLIFLKLKFHHADEIQVRLLPDGQVIVTYQLTWRP